MLHERSFVALDGLRGIAAIIVAVEHASGIFGVRMPEAYLAVDFFFMLSGFVLARAYDEQLRKGMSARDFIMRRLIRLYPLYGLGVLGSFGLALYQCWQSGAGSAALLVDFGTAILFLPSPLSPNLYPLNDPAWSLLFELLVNFWFGVIGRYLNGFLLWSTVVVCAVLLVILVFLEGTLNFGALWRQFPGGCARVGFAFFTGVLLYRIWLTTPSRLRLPVPVVGAALLALLVLPIPHGYDALYASIVALGIFPLFIWIAASSPAPGIAGRACAWLGAISYGVYMLHMPIWHAAFAFGVPPTLSHGLLLLMAMLIMSDLATRYFERPLRRGLAQRFSQMGQPER